MNVAKSTPKPSDTAIGTMNAASKLRFHIRGPRPKKREGCAQNRSRDS